MEKLKFSRKYKKLEANARHELNKLKMEHEQTLKRLNTLDNENRKLVYVCLKKLNTRIPLKKTKF